MGFFKTKKEKHKDLLQKLQSERLKTAEVRDIATIKEEIGKAKKERFDLRTKGIKKFGKGTVSYLSKVSEAQKSNFKDMDEGFDLKFSKKQTKRNKKKKGKLPNFDLLDGGYDFGF